MTEKKKRARIPFNEKLSRLDTAIADSEDRTASLKERHAAMIAAHKEKATAMLAEAGE